MMIWRAWKNSKGNWTGTGYGLKIDLEDRLKYFRREWKSVTVELPQATGYVPLQVNIDKDSFWKDSCGELISKEIGQWILKIGRWPKYKPWKFEVQIRGERTFRVLKQIQ